jgi:hypothetical protein
VYRPALFVGSSSEGQRIAEEIQVLLDPVCEVELWTQGMFGLTQGTLESLVMALSRFDFALLVLTADDLTISRGTEKAAARDNVLFELGLFIGSLGRDRTFMLYDRTNPPALPSDLAGITAATFAPHASGNLEAALGAPSTKIRNAIERLDVRSDKGLRTLENVVQESGRLTESLFDQIASERRIFLTQLASTDPRKAIKQAWEMVREAAIDVAGRRGISWTSTKDFTELLSREGQLSGPVVKLILDLRTLRYEMADEEDQEIRSTTATAYVAAAANVADMLRTLPRGPRVGQ